MSASSLCVTCGIITQLRASTGPEIRWIRDRCTRSISPNFEKSIDGHGGEVQAETGAAGRRRGRRGCGRAVLDERLHVLLGDPALAAAAGHLVQVDAELARDPADRGAGVDGACAVARGSSRRRGFGRRWRGRRGLLLGLGRAVDRIGRLRPRGRGRLGGRGRRRRPREHLRRRRPMATASAGRRPEKPCPRSSRAARRRSPQTAPARPSSPCRTRASPAGRRRATMSPGETRISMIGTSVKSPMSGTSTDTAPEVALIRSSASGPRRRSRSGRSPPARARARGHPRPRATSGRTPRRSGGRPRRTAGARVRESLRPKPSVPSAL